MRKPKPLPYKKGDQILYIEVDSMGIRLNLGVVTLVKRDAGLVYAEFDNGNWKWKRKFGRVPGNFQENPWPIWKIRLVNGDNIRKLKKRAEKATKNHHAYRQAYANMEYEVDRQARDWKIKEIDRRRAEIPHGYAYLRRVASRMGFRVPTR